MFTPNRFVVVDDKQDDLDAIRSALERLGTSCVTVLYDPSTGEVPDEPFQHVRVLFMDLQLNTYMGATNFNSHYATIQRILEQVISNDCGPYVMVLWTTMPEKCRELQDYLTDHVREKHVLPATLLPLPKADFIGATAVNLGDAASLAQAIADKLESAPALAALLQWEAEIIRASGRVMHDVVGLDTASDGALDLRVTMRRLAEVTVGEHNVAADPQAAMHSALLPLLQDHIQHELVDESDTPTIWHRALEPTTGPMPTLRRNRAAELNSRLHLGGKAGLKPTTWGAVCELEDDVDWPEEFGIESPKAFRDHIKGQLKAPSPSLKWEIEGAQLAQIRIGASCDYAQQKPGPIPYALAAFCPITYQLSDEEHAARVAAAKAVGNPSSSKQKLVDLHPLTLNPNATSWCSPILEVVPWGLGHFVINPRFVRIRGQAAAEKFKVIDRFREQLLLELIFWISQQSSRPGIVEFNGVDPKPLAAP